MRLADFIRRRRDAIIDEWQKFAATMQPAAAGMSLPELRGHAAELLDAAAKDLVSRQSPGEQRHKSRGRGSARRMAMVAQRHAIRRLHAGFRLQQVLAEYRALRASVVRLWEEASPQPSAARQRDLTRFHEAVDEALTEAVSRYAAQLDEYRDQFLGILGHDLRNPLAAILMSATALAGADGMSDEHVVVARRIIRASGRMGRLVNDLLELTRVRLGEGITITKKAMNLEPLCHQVVDELRAAHPDRRLILECTGDLRGHWDADRLAQVISNLVANALQHGDATKPVTIRATSGRGAADVTVHNYGKPIPPSFLKTILDPVVRSSRGLGIFIVRELVDAHGGTLRVTSSDEDGTTFVVTLPQRRSERPETRRRRQRPHLAALSASS